MFSTANAMPVDSSSAAMPSTKSRGVLLLPPERRVHDDHLGADRGAISAERSSLPQGSVPQTRWVNSRHGAWIAQTGISWWSESCWTAEVCWLSASMPTITSTAS